MKEQHTDKCCYWDDEEFCDCGDREIRRLTAANADLQQRLDAAEEALRVAQGEAERWQKLHDVNCGHLATIGFNNVPPANKVIEIMGTALTAANSRVERLRETLEELTTRAIVLSDDYLESFKCYADDRTVQGWEVGRWRMLALAHHKAQKALADDAREGM